MKTKSQLVSEITALILSKYPVPWTVKELEIVTRAKRRTIERALADMLKAGLLEKRYSEYTLHSQHVNQIYGAQWYVKQQMDKDILIKIKEES